MDQEYLKGFIENIVSDTMFERFLGSVRGGSNKVYLRQQEESLILDETWIDRIDAVLFNIELILRNPKKFIKEDELIIDVERARKTNSKTVRHLASHSRNIRKFDERGDVIPRKVLTVELNEDVAIYENRFVVALINRLHVFVKKRRDAISEHEDMFVKTLLNTDTKFNYGRDTLTCKIELGIKEPPRNLEQAQRMEELIAKIETMLKRIRVIQSSEFYRDVSKAKPVRPPIQKTNIIRMQTDYRECYQLWMYLATYDALGYSVEIKDKTLPVEGDYFDDLTVVSALSMQAMLHNGLINKERYEAMEYSAPFRKDYKTQTKVEFEASFAYDKEQGGDDIVNEYYYQQMKNAFAREAKRPENDGKPFLQEKELQMSFMRYYRSIAKVNDMMYRDLISKQAAKPKSASVLDKKIAEAEEQELYVKRLKQLAKLRAEDMARAERQEKTEHARLIRMKAEVIKERKRIEEERLEKARRLREEEKRKEEERQRKEQEERQKAAEEARKVEEAARKAEEAARKAEEAAKKPEKVSRKSDKSEKFDRMDNPELFDEDEEEDDSDTVEVEDKAYDKLERLERQKLLAIAEEKLRLQKLKEAEKELKRLQAAQLAAMARIERERAKLLAAMNPKAKSPSKSKSKDDDEDADEDD